LKDESSAARIETEWLSQSPAIPSINLGETLYMRIRERGEKAAAADIATIRRNSVIVDPDWALVPSPRRSKQAAACPTLTLSAPRPPRA